MSPPEERGHFFGGQPMRKSKAVRVAGFVGALGASAALVGFAATGTGAYFSESHTGTIQASNGSVKLTVSPSNGILTYSNLLPGVDQKQTVGWQATGTGAQDIWLVFPTTSKDGSNPSEALTGQPEDAAKGGLGRYGHFAVNAPAGSFNSYNLSNRRTSDPNGAFCPINVNGLGGSAAQAADKNDYSLPYCAPKNAILLQSGLTYGQTGSADLIFGLTKLATDQTPSNLNISYKIVATQAGVRPDDPNVDPAN